MGLFTDPMTLVDNGSSNRTFSWRAQLYEPGATVGEYIETAATVASNSKLVVKHSTTSKGIKRHLVQRTMTFDITADPSDGNEPIVCNFTISHHPAATWSQISDQVVILIDALGESDFVSNIIRELL